MDLNRCIHVYEHSVFCRHQLVATGSPAVPNQEGTWCVSTRHGPQTPTLDTCGITYWKEGFHWSATLFAMTPKEQQMHDAVRMSTYTVPTRRLWHATLEHNIKEEVFPLVPDQTMSMPGHAADQAVTVLEPGSSTGPKKRKAGRYWVGKISLDFRKWCQHFADRPEQRPDLGVWASSWS